MPERPFIDDPETILVIKPSSLGDVVHTLPAVRMVREHWPGARLTWLVNPEWAPLLEGNRDLDAVKIFPRGEFRGWSGLGRFREWLRAFRRERADLVLDFQGLLRSAVIGRACRAERGLLFGLSDAREGARFFYQHTAAVQGIAHAVDRYLALAEFVGAERPEELGWPLPAGSAPAGFALREDEPFVLLHPFSRGAGKSLDAADVAAMAAALAPVRVVIAGRADERIPPAENVVDLLNRTTLGELIWLIRRAAFVVSVDSGPMHIASALTPHLLSIHTWSDPAKVGPYRREAWVWKEGRLFQQQQREETAAHQPVADLVGLAAFVRAQLPR